jgi:hypothetical protein
MKHLYVIMAVCLLLSLLPMPYGYYILLRYGALVVFAYLGYSFYRNNDTTLAYTFAALAVLFQPFIKIALGRGMWNFVDVVVACFLLYLWKRK